MTPVHYDEAKNLAGIFLHQWLQQQSGVSRVLLVADLFGKLRLVIWATTDVKLEDVKEGLNDACGQWWSGDVLLPEQADASAREFYDRIWNEGRASSDDDRFMFIGRHRSRTAWFEQKEQALWATPEMGPPIVVFYSFKGGLGRTTALSAFAIQRAQAGERVCVLDFDLDSPGIGLVLSANEEGGTALWGVVDFLLEHSTVELPLSDYYHRCDRVAGPGEIVVVPAGALNDVYLDKLARIDLEEAPSLGSSGIAILLSRIRDELKPNWILIDARTGISEPAGQLLSGLAHLHVLLGTTQDQSWQGLNRVLDRLGRERVEDNCPQGEIVMVQAMVPAGEAGRLAIRDFLARSQQEFTDRYYAEADESEEATASFWDIRDADNQDAPHSAVPIYYDARLVNFEDVIDIVESLKNEPFVTLADRILSRFVTEPTK